MACAGCVLKESATAAIVVPARNAASWLPAMVARLFETTPGRGWTLHVVVVDAGSADGTAAFVAEARRRYRNLHLVSEETGEGIDAAYLQGVRYATRDIGADVLIAFDADLRQAPDRIPLLLERIRSGADVVVGSRRVEKRGRPLAGVVGFLVRLLLFFPTRAFSLVPDPAGGIKGARVSGFVDRLDLDRLSLSRDDRRTAILYRLVRMGARVEGIPAEILPPASRESDATSRTPRQMLGGAFRLRLSDQATLSFLRFAAVGLAGFLVNAVALELFAKSATAAALAAAFRRLRGSGPAGFLAEPSSWAAAIAAECAIVSNYVWNNRWTFSSRRIRRLGRLVSGFLKFNATSLGAILFQLTGVGIAVHLIADSRIVRQAALAAIVAVAVIPYNWLMYNRVIWKADRPGGR